MATKKTKKNEDKYCCNYCDFNTCKITDYKRHLETKKHIGNTMATSGNQNLEKILHTCENCNKTYNDRTGLWKHKKNCKTKEYSDSETSDKDQLILMLIKQNTDLIKESTEFKNIIIAQNTSTQNMMMEVIKTGTHNTNITHTNSHNKAFNLNFFLNETCKDAMNIMDFVDSIKLQLSDLEKVGELGYVEGISNIITKNLKELDVTQRPVHCTDKKRETIYIKDENKWEKEDEEKKKLRKVIRRVAFKNQRLLPEFKKEHPDCGKYNSKFSDQYNKIVVESMGGPGDNESEKEEKIIRNISKNIIVDK